ncbi:MAG: helix-turn-helix transcriptional regulator [Flavobacteriales bacterium]
MTTKKLKLYTLSEVKDQVLGEPGTPDRDSYEHELQMELIGDAIKEARTRRNLTQEQLGKLVGVQKAQISKLENNSGNVTIDTILRVFTALHAKVRFSVELSDRKIKVA